MENQGTNGPNIRAGDLGSARFRKAYGVKYAYLTGAMYRGIASKELVVRMGKAGLMGYFGAGGFSVGELEEVIQWIQGQLNNGESYGMNLLCNLINPEVEMQTVGLYLKYGIGYVEAAAFMQITPALVWYRLKGLRQEVDGKIICDHKIMAKVSRPAVAALFMSPAPERIVKKLLAEGKISEQQAQWAKNIPMSQEICVEADSGGHTDMGIPTVLLPAMLSLKEEMERKYAYHEPLTMGLAGGIGSPEAGAATLMMGADFILTGSINQCTVEGGTSEAVKNLLQEINVQDTDYAPAGDMFELGAKVQVLKKGVFFPARANKLYSLYNQYDSLEDIPEVIQKQVQEKYFKKSFQQIWEETKTYLRKKGQEEEIAKAEQSGKHKMALVFRWYFGYSARLAFAGDEENRVDYQVHTGPALGAFNQWVKDTPLADWRNRHVDEIAEKLMTATADLLNERYAAMTSKPAEVMVGAT